MATYRNVQDAQSSLPQTVVTIGNFDGAHRGHQSLFARTRELAEPEGLRSVALTFSPHPTRFFRPELPPFRLTPDDLKSKRLHDYGLDDVVILPFDRDMAGLSPEDFVSRVLIEGLHARHVVVGHDFRFGKGRAGTVEVLEELGEDLELKVHTCDPVELEGEVVSSSRIREHIRQGEISTATDLLGHPFTLVGLVIHGDARGRMIGFPTANIACDNELLPPDGIYVSTLHDPEHGSLHSATYIGKRPTYYEADGRRTVEAFAFDLPEETTLDLYHHDLALDLHERLRADRAFDSTQALVDQIARDVEAARTYFSMR